MTLSNTLGGFGGRMGTYNDEPAADRAGAGPGDLSQPDKAGMLPTVADTVNHSALSWALGLLAVLLVLRVAQKSPDVPGVPGSVRVNVWNFIAVGCMAVLGLVILKVAAARLPLPGLRAVLEFAA